MVVTGDEGAKVKLSSATGADTWEYTVPAGGVTDALVTTSDGDSSFLKVAPNGDKIKMESLTGNPGDLLIKTVSVWEPESGADGA